MTCFQSPCLCCPAYLFSDIEAIKAMMRLFLPLFFSLLAAGCCPIQGPNACADNAHWDIYKANLRVEDYGLFTGQTDKTRLKDWKECGGAKDGSYDIDEKTRTHEEYWRESMALFNRIRLCMEAKNYTFVGECDSELKRAYPSCGEGKDMSGPTGGNPGQAWNASRFSVFAWASS